MSYLFGIWEPSGFEFGKNRVPINNDIKDAAASGNQLCRYVEFLLQFGCQTDSGGFVISFTAIANLDVHDMFPFR